MAASYDPNTFIAALFPRPKEMTWKEAPLFSVDTGFAIHTDSTSPEWKRSAEIFRAMLQETSRAAVTLEKPKADATIIELQDSLHGEKGNEEYRLQITQGKILLQANHWKGALYAGMTLLQLLQPQGAYSPALPCCTIHDWPDVPLRAASRWLIGCECWVPAYDWGDGKEAMLQRYRRKIDFALRNKINVAFFEGFDWHTEKYPGYTADMRALNAYAAERNVILEYGGFAVSLSNFTDPLSSSKGLGPQLNREYYPDGPVYHCIGRKPHQFSFTRTFGTCRSNDTLYRFKQDQLADYVRRIEPRMLYIHNEDSGYEDLEEFWPLRCKHCREKWPSDALADPQGAAGAIAYGYTKLYQAVCSVKNDHYDGARDCRVVLISPVYGAAVDNDDITAKSAEFWRVVSSLLPPADTLYMGIREQMRNEKDNSLRITPIVNAIHQKGHKVFLFALNGSDNFLTDGQFAAGARFNSLYKGVDCLFNFSGALLQEPQEAYNSECCWNIPEYPVTDAKMVKAEYAQCTCYTLPEEPQPNHDLPAPYGIPKDLLSANGFLTRYCHRFYGPEAGDLYLQFIQIGRVTSHAKGFAVDSEFPLIALYSRFRRKGHFCFRFDFRRLTDIPQRLLKWQTLLKMTTQAKELIAKAVPASKGYAGHDSLVALLKFIQVGEAFAELCTLVYAEKPDWEFITRKIDAAQALADKLFPFIEPNPHDGEIAFWEQILGHLRRVVVEHC